MGVQQHLAVVKRWWWLLLALTLLLALLSTLIVLRLPPSYEATTTLRVGQVLESPNPSSQEFYISQQLAHTYKNMASRQPILRNAVEAIGLPFVPREKDVSARLVPDTQFLEISVRDRDPTRARDIANALAQQLILQSPRGSAEDQGEDAFVRTQLQDLQAEIEAARQEIAAEQEKLNAAREAQPVQQYQDNIIALQQSLASYRSTYAALLQTVSHRTNDISVFEPAGTPSGPVSPRVHETVLAVACIGFFLALGVAYLFESLDDTLNTADELAHLTGLPTLGTIGRMKNRAQSDSLITVVQPRSSIAEAYRSLRTNIQFCSVDKPLRAMIVTSPRHLEGKTTAAANLGVVVAQAGKSVVLVDADLRRPSLHRVFDVPNERGLTDALTGEEVVLDGRLQKTRIDNLRVLTSGPLPPNPSELLGSNRMNRLIEQLKVEADMVIFDTSPVLAVTDAAVLSRQTDGALLVAEARRTRRATVLQAMETLQQVEANIVGGVLNKFAAGRSERYYYYGEPPPR
jgi:succinoglycan biosynthesis transport protein ExoP